MQFAGIAHHFCYLKAKCPGDTPAVPVRFAADTAEYESLSWYSSAKGDQRFLQYHLGLNTIFCLPFCAGCIPNFAA